MKSYSWSPILATLSPYMKKERWLIFTSILSLLGATAMRLLEPWPLAFVIDKITGKIANSESIHLLSWTADWSIETWLWACAIAVIAIAGLKATLSFVSTLGLALAGSRILSEVRTDLFEHLQKLPISFFKKKKTGDLAMRLISDVGMLREVTVTALMPLLASILVLTGMITVMLILDWKLTLLAFSPLPLLLVSTFTIGNKIKKVSRVQRKREGSLAATASEFIGGMSIVQSLSIEKTAIQQFSGDDAKSLKQNVRSKRLAAGLERKVDLIVALAIAIVLYVGAKDVVAGNMSPGDLMVFLSYLKNSFRPVREYAKYTGRLAKAIASGERIVNLMNIEPEIKDSDQATALPKEGQKISFKNITFSYDDADKKSARNNLNSVSFQVSEGEKVAIVGPSGAGKSTLALLLLRLYEQQSGSILINEHDLANIKLDSLRKSISFIPQETLLFNMSVRDNITISAHRKVTEEDIIQAAKLANAHDFIMALPEGYDSILSERGSSLSGGQRQRISIARAALRDNLILLLDEPNTGLDRQNEHEINEALIELMKEKTCILITHSLEFAAKMDRILFFEDGQLLEQGTHNELLKLNDRYAQFWTLQARSASKDESGDQCE